MKSAMTSAEDVEVWDIHGWATQM